MKKIGKLLEKLMKKEVSLFFWAGCFLSIIFLRVFTEQFIAQSTKISTYQLVIEYIHNLYFFLITFILIWLFLSLFLKINPQKLAFVFLWASFFILIPPFLDMIKTKGEIFWSFYIIGNFSNLKNQFVTVFGDFPSGIAYFGTKMTFISAIFFIAALIFFKTRNIFKTAMGAFSTYGILFFMGSFPTLFVFAYNFIFGQKKIFEINSFDIAGFFGSPRDIFGIGNLDFMYAFPYKLELFYYPLLVLLLTILFFISERRKFLAFLKNLRYPQLIYHGGLFFLGMALGFLQYSQNFSLDIFSWIVVLDLIISVFLAWIASVCINDIFDLEIDRISSPDRPLPKGVFSIFQYAEVGFICFLLSLLGGMTVGFNFFVLLFVYQIIAWFYSAEPFRLKKFPIIATFVSSLASLMILFSGYILMSDNQTIYTLSWRIILLLIVAYTISIPIKDFKDIEGDKKYEIWTIPVVFGRKNGKQIIAICHFCSYILSVFFLNERKLFFWAILFGTINYLIVISKKIDPRRIFWWVLVCVSIYLLIMVKIIFIDNLGKFNF